MLTVHEAGKGILVTSSTVLHKLDLPLTLSISFGFKKFQEHGAHVGLEAVDVRAMSKPSASSIYEAI